MPTATATLTMAQMITLARQVGFTGNDAVIAGAVGMAESGGRPTVHNPILPYVVGVWQINTRAHPQYTEAQMENAAANARATYAVWRSSGWKAWSTYTSGAYKQYMPAASAANITLGGVGKAVGGSAGGLVGAAVNPIQTGKNLAAIDNLINAAMNPTVWRRVLLVIIGIILILIGLVKMSATPRNIQLVKNIAEVVPK